RLRAGARRHRRLPQPDDRDPARAAPSQTRAPSKHRPSRRLAQVCQHRPHAALDRAGRHRMGGLALAPHRSPILNALTRLERSAMTPKQFSVLAAAAAVTLAAAIAIHAARTPWTGTAAASGKLFPG